MRISTKILPRALRRLIDYHRMCRAAPSLSIGQLGKSKRQLLRALPAGYQQGMEAVIGGSIHTEETMSARKYVDLDFWLRVNIARAYEVGVVGIPPQRVLDLGCGPALFLATCRYYGHQVNGVDLPLADMPEEDRKVYAASCSSLGLENRISRFWITPGLEALPPRPASERYQIITAFMIRFYCKETGFWSVDEWIVFLKRLADYLTDDGYCFLDFNAEPAQFGILRYYDQPTAALLAKLGTISGGTVRIYRNSIVKSL